MNVIIYKMVKQALLDTAPCRDGYMDYPCNSCLAESVTHMLEDEFILSPKFSTHEVEEV